MSPVPASVIVVTHNSRSHLAATLEAVGSDPAPAAEVIVVDNASSDDTRAIALAAGAHLVALGANLGFGAGCHAGVAVATQPVLVFLNPDARPETGWLPPLCAALDEPGVGAAMATQELASQPGYYGSSGGALTYYGLAWVTDVGTPIRQETAPVETPFPSGAAMAIRREIWERFDGFRTDLFMYHEDTDLGWRLRMQGLRSVRVPDSMVAHDYDFGRNPDKLATLERNRLLLLAANYRRSTRLVLAPMLILVELGILITALRDGWGRRKVASWREAWQRRDDSRQANRRLQATRTVGDAALLATMETRLSGISQVARPAGTAVLDRLLTSYLRLVLPLVRRADRRAGLG